MAFNLQPIRNTATGGVDYYRLEVPTGELSDKELEQIRALVSAYSRRTGKQGKTAQRFNQPGTPRREIKRA